MNKSNLNWLIASAAIYVIGYLCGEKKGSEKANQNTLNLGRFYKNQAEKQAVQIEMIQDRLVYLSVGEVEKFVEFMKDESDEGFGVDENYPVLAIVNPLDKADLDLNLEERGKNE